ncbi:Argininosuccinate lyase [Variovorax sp. PBL-H6]|uniref:Bug family tripartite tricarboxylate transporter substrate binding protein n=1 Tax=Variovorax sp. PBL-H6 TaxID=434009 RepID=UPI001317385F|nr:tripartite tricarboxylate transporter substrate binding protein [Variovorax sp. PBL-H6]VTU21507.1 Argininosuccinate lyase [Variovorax sp. PBL-H6]
MFARKRLKFGPACTRRRWFKALAAGIALPLVLGASGSVGATAFPDKPIRLIVPYNPGGITDSLARRLAELMRQDLQQPVIVENKPGGNTALGARAVASAAPDGYTVLFATGATAVLNPLLYPKLSYNPDKELLPVARVAITPMVMVVGPNSTYRALREFVVDAKANPGKFNYASTGTGSSLHLAVELLQSETGISLVHVPFNGSAPAQSALMGGDVQFFADAAGSSMALVQGGRLRALAVTSRERLPALPEVPTVAESGYPNVEVTTWFGLMLPRNAPADVANRLNVSAARAIADPSFRQQFEALGLVVPPAMTQAEFVRYIGKERERWAPLIRAKNIVLE